MRICAVCLAMLLMIAASAGFPVPPQEASTHEELIARFGPAIGFGAVEKWEFTTGETELLVFGYCPYSGRTACYVHVYYHDLAKRKWILFIDRSVEPAIGLSADISADHWLTIKDRDGKVLVKKSVANLPR